MSDIKCAEIQFREIGRDDWPLVKQLFGSRGACGGCWCMHWRREKGGKAWEAAKGDPNRRAFKKLIESGEAHGVIALDDGQPVGWCSFGRRIEFPRLERTRAFQPVDSHPGRTRFGASYSQKTWSVNCLFLAKGYRGLGLASGIVATAIKAIRKRRGKLIEAYPVTLTQDGKKLPAAFSFTGPEIVYQRLGFREVQRLALTRPLYCLELE